MSGQYTAYANEMKSIFYNVSLLKPNFPLATLVLLQLINMYAFLWLKNSKINVLANQVTESLQSLIHI